MKLLYLAHRIPYPPDKGDKIRAYHQLRWLCREHEVDLVTLVDDPDDERWIGALEEICRSVHAHRLSGLRARFRALGATLLDRPFSPAYFREPEAVRSVQRLLRRRRPDALMLFCSSMGAYLPEDLSSPVLADYCDLDSEKWAAAARHGRRLLRFLYGHEARALGRYEVALARRCHRIAFATPAEAADFRDLQQRLSGSAGDVEGEGAPRSMDPGTDGRRPRPGGADGARVHAIQNGVDLARFARTDDAPVADVPTVVFTGAMDYIANVEAAEWFLEEVWPGLRRRLPGCRLQIVGRRPPGRLRDRDGHDGVTVTGYVPEIVPYLHAAWVAIAPMHIARGVQNKVLEAMAAGLPTVISPPALRGVDAEPGAETVVADGVDEWTRAVTRLLEDDGERRRLGEAGRRYVHRNHSWETHGRTVERLLREIVAEASAAGARASTDDGAEHRLSRPAYSGAARR